MVIGVHSAKKIRQVCYVTIYIYYITHFGTQRNKTHHELTYTDMITLPRKCLWQALNCVRYHTTQALILQFSRKSRRLNLHLALHGSIIVRSGHGNCFTPFWWMNPPTPIICLWWHYLPEYVMAEQCLHLDWMHMVLLRKLYCLTKQSSNLMIPTRWLLKSLGNSVFNSWQTQLDEANRIKDDLTGFFSITHGSRLPTHFSRLSFNVHGLQIQVVSKWQPPDINLLSFCLEWVTGVQFLGWMFAVFRTNPVKYPSISIKVIVHPEIFIYPPTFETQITFYIT